MISRIRGTLLTRDLEGRVEVETPGGVVYEMDVPLTVLQRLPSPPAPVELRTHQIVREDGSLLYGFLDAMERELFRRLLVVQGVGPRVALQALSTYNAPRLAQAVAEKDVKALQRVSGVGRKLAEKIVLELSDRVTDLAVPALDGADGSPRAAQEAVAALVALGFAFPDADAAVRGALEAGEAGSAEELIRRALARR